eukprot:GHUV01027543.1.p1 GENE.GHUV01027543.1~~GHUV01027543.1.p1  ORF type:complete len:358 (+),score=97.04 GHUV01027543.1:464-1537(+)
MLQQHLVVIGDVRRQADTNEMTEFVTKLLIKHPGSATDLQVARIDDNLLAATSTSNGGICVVTMQLPPVAAATTADLQFVEADDGDEPAGTAPEGNTQYLHHLPHLHKVSAASIDVNTTIQAVLSVAGDGSISITPLDALAQLGDSNFKAATGWSGYSQGRWVDSRSFATTGVLGGLQVWDTRRGPTPVSSSPTQWGHTGCAQLDRQLGPARQLLCLDVHPSRPNLAATGASGGTIALWDLRFQSAPLALTGDSAAAGDVWELKFGPCEPLMSSSVAALPPLLYCTSDGTICQTGAAGHSSQANGWGSGGTGALSSEVLVTESCSINSFDVEPSVGQDIIAATDYECILLFHRHVEL